MPQITLASVFLFCVTVGTGQAQASSPQDVVDYAKAIAYGQSFKSRAAFLGSGMKDQKIQLAGVMALDAASKSVTFFSDFDVVASAAALAKQEMRDYTVEDAKSLPLTGLTYAHVEVHGMGIQSRIATRYIKNSAHLVLEVDGKVIQPLRKELTAVPGGRPSGVVLLNYWETKNVSILSGGPLEINGQNAVMEFVFPLDLATLRSKKGKVILIDGEGNKHQKDVNFGKVFR